MFILVAIWCINSCNHIECIDLISHVHSTNIYAEIQINEALATYDL